MTYTHAQPIRIRTYIIHNLVFTRGLCRTDFVSHSFRGRQVGCRADPPWILRWSTAGVGVGRGCHDVSIKPTPAVN